MTKKQTITTDISSSFGNDISLHHFIGQRTSVDILKTAIEQTHNDHIDGRNPEIPSILLVGPTGKKTLAQALHNAIGNLNFHTGTGQTLGMAEDISLHFREADENTTLYIQGSDCLSIFAVNIIQKILCEKMLYVYDPFTRTKECYPYNNRWVILSASDESRINPAIAKAIDIRCVLTKYTDVELYQIVKQRCDYLGWKYRSDEVLRIIAANAYGIAGQAMKILQMSYRVMRSLGKNTLTENHVNRAVQFVQSGNDGQGQG